MSNRFDPIVLTAVLMAASSLGWAQGAGATAAAVPAETVQPPSTPPAEAYSYRQEGRRDPFVSLLSSGLSSVPQAKLAGLGGIATAELIVRGVMQSRGEYVALITGSDGKTYRAHASDRLADGVIRSVTPSGIVVMQDVNDPLSLVKQREVRKGLRTAENGK
jgi:Tfp pilus assembly protein PilP